MRPSKTIREDLGVIRAQEQRLLRELAEAEGREVREMLVCAVNAWTPPLYPGVDLPAVDSTIAL